MTGGLKHAFLCGYGSPNAEISTENPAIQCNTLKEGLALEAFVGIALDQVVPSHFDQ